MNWFDVGTDMEPLTELEGVEAVGLLSKGGEVIWSWYRSESEVGMRTLRLIEMLRTMVPVMLNMPEIGIQRTLFQIDFNDDHSTPKTSQPPHKRRNNTMNHDVEDPSFYIYFSNVGDKALIGCIIKPKFDYIDLSTEVSRTSFVLMKKFSRKEVHPEELKEFIRWTSAKASQSISFSVEQFKKRALERRKEERRKNR